MFTRRWAKPTIEHLERRDLFASVWQAQPNPYDVDRSGLVLPRDALYVIRDINQSGVRELPTELPAAYSGPFCDINGDGRMNAHDALLVIHVINEHPNPPHADIELSEASDLNGDDVVLRQDVVYEVSSVAKARVRVEFLEGESVVQSSEHIVGNEGSAEIALTLPSAVNHLKFTITDPRGQTRTTERLTRYGNVVVEWNAALLEVVRESTNVLSTGILVKPPPPMVAKYLAMVHGAMFDAINSINPGYVGYAFDTTSNSQASPVAAAASAAYEVARHVYPTDHDKALWDKTLAEVLDTIPNDEAKSLGMDVGRQAASAMLQARSDDGSDGTSDYVSLDEVGHWRPSPPSFSEATLPQWPNVEPFALNAGNQFRPTAPPSLDSEAYATAVDEVLRLGSATSTTRTTEQSDIAKFWADGGGTATPPGHWNLIAADVSLNRDLDLRESARLFALLNYALADAGISSWDAKYSYDLWRPIDAIRQADEDGNVATIADANWTPMLNTPSFPSYTSGHSTFSGAAAAVLTALLGDDVDFSTWADPGSTGQWPPSSDVSNLQRRSFSSFEEAANEAGVSRIYGGIHFSFDNDAGLAAGRDVGDWILDHLLITRND